ncbi:hypothetical protein ALC57_09760 [Trachymyrmex cornetzi]|uniref:Uncharacterized protein n=1 Tax=Trachymyrmex cornetzi TaxID=471704 RepID=A0A195DYC0_9HYME|nr:hypothetical protein ALC57_09760 [Trachymyrmex cornetzi]
MEAALNSTSYLVYPYNGGIPNAGGSLISLNLNNSTNHVPGQFRENYGITQPKALSRLESASTIVLRLSCSFICIACFM